ncbi:MAG TPA: hypothetical protein VI636_02675 [Candidatus Angelobacter sp.]
MGTDAAGILFAAAGKDAVRGLADSISGGCAAALSFNIPDSGTSPGSHPSTQCDTDPAGAEYAGSEVMTIAHTNSALTIFRAKA